MDRIEASLLRANDSVARVNDAKRIRKMIKVSKGVDPAAVIATLTKYKKSGEDFLHHLEASIRFLELLNTFDDLCRTVDIIYDDIKAHCNEPSVTRSTLESALNRLSSESAVHLDRLNAILDEMRVLQSSSRCVEALPVKNLIETRAAKLKSTIYRGNELSESLKQRINWFEQFVAVVRSLVQKLDSIQSGVDGVESRWKQATLQRGTTDIAILSEIVDAEQSNVEVLSPMLQLLSSESNVIYCNVMCRCCGRSWRIHRLILAKRLIYPRSFLQANSQVRRHNCCISVTKLSSSKLR